MLIDQEGLNSREEISLINHIRILDQMREVIDAYPITKAESNTLIRTRGGVTGINTSEREVETGTGLSTIDTETSMRTKIGTVLETETETEIEKGTEIRTEIDLVSAAGLDRDDPHQCSV